MRRGLPLVALGAAVAVGFMGTPALADPATEFELGSGQSVTRMGTAIKSVVGAGAGLYAAWAVRGASLAWSRGQADAPTVMVKSLRASFILLLILWILK